MSSRVFPVNMSSMLHRIVATISKAGFNIEFISNHGIYRTLEHYQTTDNDTEHVFVVQGVLLIAPKSIIGCLVSSSV